MKKQKSQAWIEVFQELNVLMERNLDKWSSIEEIRKTYDEFISNLKKLKDLQPELEKDLAPVEQELSEKRMLLVQKVFPVGSILEVYAVDHRIRKKSNALLISRKQLESYSSKDLLDHATRIHKLTNKYMHRTEKENDSAEQVSPTPDINRYGLTRSMMDELSSASHQFQSARKLRNDVISYRKKTRRKSDELIRANRKLLKNRLNKLMTVFSGMHPAFYQEYSKISSKN